MKAKIKPLIILTAVFLISLVAGVAAGCSVGMETAADIADEKGLTCPVTYYANGGNFVNGNDNMPNSYLTVYYAPESNILNLGAYDATFGGEDGNPLKIARTNYVFLGWKYCLLDENGNPFLTNEKDGIRLNYFDNGTADMREIFNERERQKAERGKRVLAAIDYDKGDVFAEADSKVQIHENEHLFLVAEWAEDVKVKYVLDLGGEENTMTVQNGNRTEEWKHGDVIATKEFGNLDIINLTPKTVPTKGVTYNTHTYIGMYLDEECNDPVVLGKNSRVTKPEEGDVNVYVKFLEGTDWVPVRDPAGVSGMISEDGSSGLKKFYIVNDINCAGQSMSARNSSSPYLAEIHGNGYTISNISFSALTLRNGQLSLFGALNTQTKINDLTLQNVTFNTVTIARGSTINVYAFVSDVRGANLDGFKVGGRVEVNLARAGSGVEKAIIGNMQEVSEGEFRIEPWLIGSLAEDDFISTYGADNLELVIIIDKNIVHGGQ